MKIQNWNFKKELEIIKTNGLQSEKKNNIKSIMQTEFYFWSRCKQSCLPFTLTVRKKIKINKMADAQKAWCAKFLKIFFFNLSIR